MSFCDERRDHVYRDAIGWPIPRKPVARGGRRDAIAVPRRREESAVKRRFIIEAELNPAKFDRLLEEEPASWGVHDFIEAFQEGAITEDCSMVGNEEM